MSAKKQKKQMMARAKQLVVLLCLSMAGVYYAFAGRPQAEQKLQFVEASARPAESFAAGSASGQMPEQSMQAQAVGEAPHAAQTTVAPTESSQSAAAADGESAAVQPGNVPAETVPLQTTAEQASDVADTRIDLNTAGLSELDTLPGIGPSTAQLILDYRAQYGGFASIEEIKNVKRIGDKTFEKIKDKIVVR